MSIGQDPKGLGMGLVNHESEFCPPTDNSTTGPCVLSDLGCRMFSSDSTVILEHLTSEEEGLERVRDGKLWGLLVIQENFTTGLLERLGGGGQQARSNTGGLGQVVFLHPFLSFLLTLFFYPGGGAHGHEQSAGCFELAEMGGADSLKFYLQSTFFLSTSSNC